MRIERFIETLERKRAYGLVCASSEHRKPAPPCWLDH
jgi:hypothetical protein